MLNSCQLCGAPGAIYETRDTEFVHKGIKFTVKQPGVWCDVCEDAVVTYEDMELINFIIEMFDKA